VSVSAEGHDRDSSVDAAVGRTERHVLVVASTFPNGPSDSVPSFVQDLVVALRAAEPGLRVSVLAPFDPRSGSSTFTRRDQFDEYRFRYFWPRRFQLLAGKGGIVPSLRAHRWLYLLVPFFMIAEFFAMLRIVRKEHIDVINAHWVIPQGLVCSVVGILTRLPVILTIHGGDVFTFNNALMVRLKRWAFRHSSRIIVNSSATRAGVARIDPLSVTEIIPMGVDPQDFPFHDRPDRTPLRVVFVGRLSEEKGVADLIHALALARSHGVDVVARIAGSGPQDDELRELCRIQGLSRQVEFRGWVARTDLSELYSWADVFVGPSITAATGWVEALGVVFIEASAAGLPVITTDCGGMRDIVVDGETGYLVPEHSSESIARLLGVLAADPGLRHRLGMAGRARVERDFSWGVIATRYAKALRT
jgi:glycosyltransferase involved in cell wall biosynthesis